ncbi:uncharacterized protein LOC127857134 [Dreissena polymorpha]|uniref:uncharacterized protein LOC127857134 n=1 Tax=Dreissena polymorpha TaxID=45954 RepID=UPI0022647B56|nr:uncharacterized protein LOC127857134 [Dreissena polymorpha]
MATSSSQGSINESSDFVKDYLCVVCESKHIQASAEFFCEICLKCFCEKCVYHHDQIFVNHSTYGRGEANKWPLAKEIEDLLLKCDIHNSKELKMFCQDHSQLCCSACVLLNHRQCTNLALISESAKKLSVDMKQLSSKIQTIIAELNKFKTLQEASIVSVEGSYSEKLLEIRELRKKLYAALNELENTTLKELDEIRTKLKTSLKKDVDNCSRLKDELQQLGEAVQGLCDTSKKDVEFIASRKCQEKIQESETFLKENPLKVLSAIIFQGNTDIEQYLSQQSSLGMIVESNPDQVLSVKRESQYNVKISSDTDMQCLIVGICSLPSGQVIVADSFNNKVKMFDQHYNVSSYCDMSGFLNDMCLITSSEVAVTLDAGVQFMSVSNRQLVKGRTLQFPHVAVGIAHRQGALYITSYNALYHYTLTGILVKKLYEDTGTGTKVHKCALSPFGDRIYVTNLSENKLLTLAADGSLISTFTDPELISPCGVHVTPAGQIIVCGCTSNTVIQVDCEGRKKLASLKDGLINPESICCNNNHQIIVGQYANICVLEFQ